jgi:hypothetical protein
MWHEIIERLLADPARREKDFAGREYGYADALRSLGYDEANARGLLADYHRLVLNG